MTDSIYEEPVDWAGVVEAVDQLSAFYQSQQCQPPREIRLTAQQLSKVREVIPTASVADCPGALMFGIPIVLVDDVEDSTPYLNAIERAQAMVRRVK